MILYQIFKNETCVGSAHILQEGLYYRICCNCKVSTKGIHRIVVCDDENTADLGICVPQGNEFILTSRIPVKKLNIENCSFSLVKQGNQKAKREVPVETGKPFPAIEELGSAYFRSEDSVIVIDPTQGPQDSDRNP